MCNADTEEASGGEEREGGEGLGGASIKPKNPPTGAEEGEEAEEAIVGSEGGRNEARGFEE